MNKSSPLPLETRWTYHSCFIYSSSDSFEICCTQSVQMRLMLITFTFRFIRWLYLVFGSSQWFSIFGNSGKSPMASAACTFGLMRWSMLLVWCGMPLFLFPLCFWLRCTPESCTRCGLRVMWMMEPLFSNRYDFTEKFSVLVASLTQRSPQNSPYPRSPTASHQYVFPTISSLFLHKQSLVIFLCKNTP